MMWDNKKEACNKTTVCVLLCVSVLELRFSKCVMQADEKADEKSQRWSLFSQSDASFSVMSPQICHLKTALECSSCNCASEYFIHLLKSRCRTRIFHDICICDSGIMFTFMRLAYTFIQSYLRCIECTHNISSCFQWESNTQSWSC